MVSRWLSMCRFIRLYPSIFSFPDDNLSECPRVFTKLGMCVDISKMAFANERISSIFNRVICPRHV